jgi:hypothetical protein
LFPNSIHPPLCIHPPLWTRFPEVMKYRLPVSRPSFSILPHCISCLLTDSLRLGKCQLSHSVSSFLSQQRTKLFHSFRISPNAPRAFESRLAKEADRFQPLFKDSFHSLLSSTSDLSNIVRRRDINKHEPNYSYHQQQRQEQQRQTYLSVGREITA